MCAHLRSLANNCLFNFAHYPEYSARDSTNGTASPPAGALDRLKEEGKRTAGRLGDFYTHAFLFETTSTERNSSRLSVQDSCVQFYVPIGTHLVRYN